MSSPIAANLQVVQQAVALQAARVGRDPAETTVVAVSKTFEAEIVRQALLAQHRVFGENRVQEALHKWPALKQDFPDVCLHLIGPLQTNKVKDAVALFDVIETVDRPKLARALAREMAAQNRHLPVYIQVNTGEEPQKAGVMPSDVVAFTAECQDLGLHVVGLMCIPPVADEPGVHFGFLRALAQRCGLTRLSMGMSGDYEIAVAMGATAVRVGSAIFGQRPG